MYTVITDYADGTSVSRRMEWEQARAMILAGQKHPDPTVVRVRVERNVPVAGTWVKDSRQLRHAG